MKNVKNKLRVVHTTQVNINKHFIVNVKNEEEAYLIMNILSEQHLWLEENNFIPDFSNVIDLEMYDEDIDEETGNPYGWATYFNEEESMWWDDIEDYFLNLIPNN